VSPVKYELGFYIPEDGILLVTSVRTSNLTRYEKCSDDRVGWYGVN
jgi:hypothetical protein